MHSEIDGMQEVIDLTRSNILHKLEVFPFLSRSMINQAIGTSTPTQLWVPILDDLVEAGQVIKSELTCKTPQGRSIAYAIYHLKKNSYIYGPDTDEPGTVSVGTSAAEAA